MKLFLMGLFWLLSSTFLLAFAEDMSWFEKINIRVIAIFGYGCMLWATLREFNEKSI